MMTPAIVVIAYNRPDSLERILTSLNKASYPEGSRPTLVISLDKCDVDDTVQVARKFEWKFGEKRVVERPERMGLKNHVLSCGDFTKEYGSIIVLEDDLVVSPYFYTYAKAALEFTEDADRIGGISLYNHLFNVHAREAFCAIDDGYDNWYFQFASSWGQAYTKNQWAAFMVWYGQKTAKGTYSSEMQDNPFVPANVSGWSDKSWLKYYITYLVETDKYFLYPKVSYTTNFGDVGSHMDKPDYDLQVPLCGYPGKTSYTFSSLDESRSVYDSYFENDRISQLMRFGEGNMDLLCDLYGIKPIEEMQEKCKRRYILSSQALPYKVLRLYGRQMRPHDANVIYDVAGNDFYQYDTCESAAPPTKDEAKSRAAKWFYQYRGISAAQMKDMLKYRVKEAIEGKLKK